MIDSGERIGGGHIVAICSVELELRPFLGRMAGPRPVPGSRLPLWTGRIGEAEVVAVAGGMGKTNAAHALTVLLESGGCTGVVGFGVAGAFLTTGLEPGAIAIATEEIYGDEGVSTPTGWLSCEGVGIPLHSRPGADFFNRFPVDGRKLPGVVEAVRSEGSVVATGPFVTVSCCSGTTERGQELAERFGAICESMEGAAYAHVAAIYGTPYIEIRGISNRVEDRDLSAWRLTDAAGATARAVAAAIPAWQPASDLDTRP